MGPKTDVAIHTIIERLISIGTAKQCHQFFQKYHEADIAEALHDFDITDQIQFLKKFNAEIAGDILEEMDIHEQGKLLSQLKTTLAAEYIGEMDPDNAVDLLEELFETNEDKAEEILEALPDEDAEDLEKLLAYEEASAGAIMSTDFLAIPENLTVQKALEHIKTQDPPDTEVSFYIYVIDDVGKLIGFTTLRNLLMATPRTRITSIRNDNPIYCTVDMDQEEVANQIQKYDLVAIPVVNPKKELVGLITVDDIVDVVVEEATEDLYRLSGTSDFDESKLLQGNLFYAIKSRLPWLLLSILGGLIASYIITTYSSIFSNNHFSLALSLSFLPLLMALGGNVGGQSATIIVRGLSTGTIRPQDTLILILREFAIGAILGAIIGGLVFLFNWHFNIYMIAIIVSLSLVLNMTVAALMGTIIPLFFKRVNIDPAVASAPFISSTLDIIGQLIYFTLTLQIILRMT